jgi:hypothetical protein
MIEAPCTNPLAARTSSLKNELEADVVAIGSAKTGKTGEFRLEPRPVFLGRYAHGARRQE